MTLGATQNSTKRKDFKTSHFLSRVVEGVLMRPQINKITVINGRWMVGNVGGWNIA